jgi:glucokinase
MERPERGMQCLAVDVGGTRTRVALAVIQGGEAVFLWQVEAPLAGKAALGRFIREALRDADPAYCAVDFAGPLEGRTGARMTNWAGNPLIRLNDLEAWGLPARRTLMLNDLESSACGILAQGARKDQVRTLYAPRRNGAAADGPRVVVAPGTGLGTASIVDGRPLPSEVQHAACSPLDARHAGVVAWHERNLGRYPSWEDLASGRGLEATYRALCAMDRVPRRRTVLHGRPADAAGAVARAAGSDPLAREALEYYYGCAGRVAQLLALALQPTGGVFLCGSTTAGNAAFIRKGRFLREFQSNAAQGALLCRFPVFMVTADLNLLGGLWACRHPEAFAGPR